MPGPAVGKYMTRDVVTLREDESLRAAVELVMVRRLRHIPILEAGGSLAGIVTDRDIKRILPSPLAAPDREEYERLLDATPVGRVMTREPMTIAAEADVAEAVQIMLDQKIGGLPVVAAGRLVGMFTQSDALRGYLELLRPGTA